VNKYEITVLIRPDLDEAGAKKALDAVAKLIADGGGNVTKEDDWGKRRLEYKIAGETHAIYHYYEVELPGAAIAKIDAALNIANNVIRHLIVRAETAIEEKKGE
jgi:small subunit ribosomal protein S6